MRTRTLLASAMLCFAASTQAQAQPHEIGFGTVELTGMGSYSSGSAGKSDYFYLSFAPDVALYLAPFAFVAPILTVGTSISEYSDTFSGVKTTYHSSATSLDAGAKVGFLINYSQNLFRPLPCFSFGGGYSAQWTKYSGNPEDKHHGPFLSPAVGLKMKISESFLLDVEQSFIHRDLYETDENTSEWRFGFSGLI